MSNDIHNLKDILLNTPLVGVFMVTSAVNEWIDSIPALWKILPFITALFLAYTDIKSDIAVIQAQIIHAKEERAECKRLHEQLNRQLHDNGYKGVTK